MEWSILFLGSVGAGKTQAIRSVSDIEVVGTEAKATDHTALIKENTTVAMDMGVMALGGDDKVVLYGAPGQDRFDFMLDILLDQAKGLVLLINNSSKEPLQDFAHYLHQLNEHQRGKKRPLVIGITHTDINPEPSIDKYKQYLAQSKGIYADEVLPVFALDPRKSSDVKVALMALTAMMQLREGTKDSSLA